MAEMILKPLELHDVAEFILELHFPLNRLLPVSEWSIAVAFPVFCSA